VAVGEPDPMARRRSGKLMATVALLAGLWAAYAVAFGALVVIDGLTGKSRF
jgi:hypothetical protein